MAELRNRLLDFSQGYSAPEDDAVAPVDPLPAARGIDWAARAFNQDPMLQQVQDARRQPAPIDQDALRGQSRARAAPRPAEPPNIDWAARTFDGAKTPSEAPQQASESSPYAEPDASTWLGRRWQDIRGKQDPRYADVGGDVSALLPNTADAQSALARAKLVAPGDDAYHDVVKSQLGPNYVRTETDANGGKIIVAKGPDGKEIKSYVNKPGLDWQDVDRGISGALPFLAAGGAVGRAVKGAPLIGRAVAQGLAGATTSVAQDAIAGGMGSDQGVDPLKAAVAGGAGVVGETLAPAVGALWSRFVTEPRYFNRAAGTLTPEGERIAIAQGIDPATLTSDLAKTFAKTYAKTGDEAASAYEAQNAGLGIRASKGQITKDPQQLLQEKAMRNGLMGDAAKQKITEFDRGQADDVSSAVLGRFNYGQGPIPTRVPDAGNPGLAQMVAPDRSLGEFNKSTIGSGIQDAAAAAKQAAKTEAEAAWSKVGPLEATPEAMGLLPKVINSKIADVAIDDTITPAAAKMAKELDAFVAGKAPGKVADILDNNPVTTVNQMRKRMLGIASAASTPEDRRAAKMLYDGFNDWIDQSAHASLLKGDPVSASNMVAARGLHREMMSSFEGAKGTPQGRILKQVFGAADSPENVVNALFVGPNAQIKSGSAQAITQLKAAFDKYLPPEQAANAWGDVKLAYVLKIAQNDRGQLNSPQILLSNLQRARSTQGSLYQSLFTQQERNYMTRLEGALGRITYKDPNPSGTATAAAGLMKQFLGNIWDAIGGKSKIGKAALEYSGIGNAWGSAQATQAVENALRSRPAPTLGQYGAAVGSESQN